MTPVPERFVATTYNLWQSTRWQERERPLQAYVELTRPDLLCVQESSIDSQRGLDTWLPDHGRVHDDFVGWQTQGNVYYSRALFAMDEHGAEDVGQQTHDRRLFWTRLRLLGSGTPLLVATIHLTFQGTETERLQGLSPRIEEMGRALAALARLRRGEEPVLLMGDFNDSINVARLLRADGFVDSFESSGSPRRPTHPATPMALGTPQVIDWQFHKGAVRSMGSYVGDFFLDGVAPSDHRPVTTTYGLDIRNRTDGTDGGRRG